LVGQCQTDGDALRIVTADAELEVCKSNARAILAMKQTSDDEVARLEVEVARLRAALERYRHCRHADLLCECYTEARAALEVK